MTKTNQIEENSVFIDVQGTLIKGANSLNHSLYTNMQHAQQRGAQVVIFTIASPSTMAQHLSKLGVDTKRFPVENKLKYRGHLFSGIIVDDVEPRLQGFEAQPYVYDPNGKMLAIIVKQLQNSPHLTFARALENYRAQQHQLHSQGNSRT